MKKRTRITVVLFIAAVIGAIGWLVVRWNAASRTGVVVTTTGPLDIRLWGIRPNAGDAIYDLNGKEIRQTLGIARWGNPYWADSDQRFDFIFELGDSNEPPLMGTFPRLDVSGEGRPLGGGFGSRIFEYKGKRLLWLRTTFARTFRRSIFFGLRTVETDFDAVDITLLYYHGPPRAAIATFKGPFKPGGKFTDETGRYEISFSRNPNTKSMRYTRFEFNTKERLGTNTSALLYDAAGKRRFAAERGASSEPAGTNIKYDMFSQRLEGITMITVGEKPFEATFKNVGLDLYGSKRRSGAAYLDEMAAKLELKLTPEKLAQYQFKNSDEALKVVDVVWGGHIISACEAILYGGKDRKRLDPAALNAEEAQRLKQIVLGWTKAMDPLIRGFAVRVGLECKWPEFVEPAFELLTDPADYDDYSMRDAQYKATDALQSYRDHLSDRDIDHIRQILPHQVNRSIFSDLKRCLERPKSESRIRALWELANDDRSWLWRFAVERLAQWDEFADKQDSLPQKLKLRLFLVRGPAGFSNVEQIAGEAYKLAGELLTPQLYALDPGAFRDVFGSLIKNVDRQQVTVAMIGFLRRVKEGDRSAEYAIDEIIKYINIWYSVDIGGLGIDVAHQTGDADRHNWPAITAEAIEWYESIQDANDANSGSP